jgi:replicative DNA helicase
MNGGNVVSFQDEADRLKAGTINPDVKSGTKLVAAEVPQVLTVRDILIASGERAMSKERADTLTMGHYKLDRLTGGFRPAMTWLFGADTSWGKSSFLISVCDENIKRKRRCLIVSSEDTEETYGDRLMVRRAKVNAQNYRDHKLEPEEIRRVTQQQNDSEDMPVFVPAYAREGEKGKANDGWPLEELLPHLGKICREQKIDLIAFDYLGEFTTKKRFPDERLKYKWMAGMMRKFIRVLKLRGIIFSQLTISSDTKIPNRHNIRECRDVANGSDGILIGFEPDVDIKDRDGHVIVEAGQKCIHGDKVKNGPRGWKVPMRWNSDHACFDTVEDPETTRIEQEIGGRPDYFEDAGQYDGFREDFE